MPTSWQGTYPYPSKWGQIPVPLTTPLTARESSSSSSNRTATTADGRNDKAIIGLLIGEDRLLGDDRLLEEDELRDNRLLRNDRLLGDDRLLEEDELRDNRLLSGDQRRKVSRLLSNDRLDRLRAAAIEGRNLLPVIYIALADGILEFCGSSCKLRIGFDVRPFGSLAFTDVRAA